VDQQKTDLNVVTYVRLICAYNVKDTSASPVIHPIACHNDKAS